MRAGYGVRFRLHGLRPATTPFTIGLGTRGVDGLSENIIEFAAEPHLKLPAITTPRFMKRASDSYSFRSKDAESFDGAYLTVVVSRIYDAPPDLEARFATTPDETSVLEELESLLAGRVRDDLRDVASLTSSLCVAQLKTVIPELWLEFQTYWATATYQKARYASPVTEIVDEFNASDDFLKGIAETVLSGLHTGMQTRAIQLAGHWYVVGRSATAGSVERFLGLFQCLEALTNYAPQEPEPTVVTLLEKLESLVAESDSPDISDMRLMLASAKERISRPVLSQRFERLVSMLALPDAVTAIEEFGVLNKLRNEILHTRRTDVPAEFRGRNVDRVLIQLAQRVLEAVAQMLVANAQARGVAVKVTDARSEAPAG